MYIDFELLLYTRASRIYWTIDSKKYSPYAHLFDWYDNFMIQKTYKSLKIRHLQHIHFFFNHLIAQHPSL